MSSSEKKPQDQPEGDRQERGGLLPVANYPPPPQQQQQQQQPQYAPPPSSEQQQPQFAPPPSSEQQQPQFAPPPTSEQQQQYFPPPPPGPPPHQEEHHDSALPPSYEQGSYVAPASEKQPIPPVQPATQQGEFPASGSEKQFPPPPPGPPPAQWHPDPLSAHPVDTTPAQYTQPPQQQPPQQQQQQQAYTIPQYNPAAPVFAPPPAQPADQTAPEAPVPEASTYTPAAVSGTTSTEQAQSHKKHGWSERFSNLGIKAAAPINSLAHKFGSQSFLPETLDKECEKAASILRTFCKKGVYADPGASGPPTSTDPKATETNDAIIDPTKNKPKNRVIVTIPPKVISKAVGLAIFTTLRAGFNVSGATGSGILVARLPDGSWGPPSGIQVHSVGGGFSIGLDIYDCVCVINSREALAAFTKTRVGLGTDLAVVAGPYGAGGAVEFGAAMENRPSRKQGEKGEKGEKETAAAAADQTLKPDQGGQADKKSHRRSLSASAFKPVFSYVKSRGFYAGIQIDGTVVVERKDANAVFYGERVPVDRILKGEVPPQGPSGMWPTGARGLLETLKGAEAGMLAREKSKEREKETPPVAAAGPSIGTEHPPAYVDDGVQRPEVGDHKYR